MIIDDCLFCPRTCPRCGFKIRGNWEHIERPQPEGSNVTICGLQRVQRPVVIAVSLWLDHAHHESVIT